MTSAKEERKGRKGNEEFGKKKAFAQQRKRNDHVFILHEM